jgi:hypothetical protein
MRDAPQPIAGNSVAEGKSVWRAAFPRRSIDDGTAEKLANGLSLTFAWIGFDQRQMKRMQTAEIVHLEEICRAARALAALVNGGGEGFYLLLGEMDDLDRDEGTSETFETIRSGLATLETAARAAMAGAKESRVAPVNDGTSPMSRHITALASIYERFSGKRAGVSSTINGDKTGPFVRFVEEASRQNGVAPPKGSTIADALRARKKANPAP